MTAPRKRFFLILMLFALSAIAVVTALIAIPERKAGPVTVSFIGVTNVGGTKQYVFRGTNAGLVNVKFVARMEPMPQVRIPGFMSSSLSLGPIPLTGEASAGRGFEFALEPRTNAGALQLSLGYTPWSRFDERCREISHFFYGHNFNALGQLFSRSKSWYYLEYDEIRE